MGESSKPNSGKSDFDALGISPPIRKEQQQNEGLECVVFYECQQALSLFFFCQTQWTYHFGGIAGLNYCAVLAVIALHERKRKKQLILLEEIQALEQGALKAWAEQAKKAAEKNKQGK